MGCHHVDLLTRVAGEPPVHVNAHEGELQAAWRDGAVLVGRYGPDATGDTMTIECADGRRVTVQRMNGVCFTEVGGWSHAEEAEDRGQGAVDVRFDHTVQRPDIGTGEERNRLAVAMTRNGVTRQRPRGPREWTNVGADGAGCARALLSTAAGESLD